MEAMEAIGMAEVERRILALREHLRRGLANIPGVTIASPPPGPLAT
jgi:selenocysteine lyase/cysteine desulfurase